MLLRQSKKYSNISNLNNVRGQKEKSFIRSFALKVEVKNQN